MPLYRRTHSVFPVAASYASVAVRRRNGQVTVEVKDDGIGGAALGGGSGLRGLADRVAALQGTLDVTSPSGRGTRIHARIALN